MFDVLIVGGGPAGLSAALMLGRCRRRVLVCDIGEPRNHRAAALHGYLTRDGIAPAAFNELGRRELPQYGVEFRCVGVTAVAADTNDCRVTLANGGAERARFLLLATGVIDDLPAIPGLDTCYGRSVFHCPYCDGWEWRDRRLAVIGHAAQEAQLALGLRTWSGDLVLCANGRRIGASQRDRLARNGIRVRDERIARIEHQDGMLSAVVFEREDVLPRDAIFFTTGQHPQSALAQSLGCALTDRGTIKTGDLCDTNVARVFVAGDASRDAQFVVVAAAEGVKAAMAINRALQAEELKP
jgi:thioredoxin reductase